MFIRKTSSHCELVSSLLFLPSMIELTRRMACVSLERPHRLVPSPLRRSGSNVPFLSARSVSSHSLIRASKLVLRLFGISRMSYKKFFFFVMSRQISGRTHLSKSSAETKPKLIASSRRVVPFLCAVFAISLHFRNQCVY